MSQSWKNSNNKKSVIKANKIFTSSLKSKNSNISDNVSTIDISLDDNITINKIKSLTTNSVVTNTIETNTIDLSNYDTSFIVFTNSIFTKKSAGFFELSGQDLSSTNLLSDNTRVNIIESDNSINFTGNVTFSKYVYVDNIDVSIIDVSIIEQNDNIVVNTNVLINKTLTASEISVNNIITDNSSILINSSMDVSGKIITSDISINQYLNTPTLKVNDICSNYNKIVINNDLSFHSNLFITDLSAYNINGLDSSLIFVNNDLSFNNLLTIGSDISDYDNIQPIDSCYNIVGNFHFPANKKVTADVVYVDKITPKAHPSAIVFKGDLSINGAVYAKFKYNYAATIDDTSANRVTLKPGGLLLVYPEGSYTTASLETFDPTNGGQSDVADSSLQISLTNTNGEVDKVRLYIKIDDDIGNPVSNFKIINTINKPPVWKKITVRNEISQYYDVVDDISYVKYDSGVSYDCWDFSENNDISENFDVSSSNIIGLKDGVINDDSYNRVYYFDLSAVDPEQFDVSYLLATKHHYVTDNVTDFSDIKLVKYHNDNNDYSNTRVEITMPIDEVELSFNLAAHDRLNYVIKSLYINVDGLVKPVEPSWNAIQLKAYDICGIGTYGHQRYTDQSWNDDICKNNPISNADMTDASAFIFDVSLYRFFGVNNRDSLYYNLDLSAVHNTDLDLSFNISYDAIGSPSDGRINTLENSGIISLSGNKIIFISNIEDICNNNNNNNIDNFNLLNGLDDVSFRDISINVLVHNYYQHGGVDASFDFSAANQDILNGDTSFEIPDHYENDPVFYSRDVSRTIVLNICDIVTNKPPNWKEISEIGISYEGSTGFDISFYTDFSFNNQFYDISVSREDLLHQTSSSYETSYIYYVWDTSGVMTDFSRLQYRIDLSALDPEGFTVDYSYVHNNNAHYDISVVGNELFITTPGRRDKDISDLSLVIWPTDNGTLPDASYYDICKNLIFHPFLYKFTEFTFRNCDVIGYEGPSKDTCVSYYNNSSNNSSLIPWWTDMSYFDMSLDSGIQIWTAPATGLYDITIAGAGGGRSHGSETKKEGFGIKFDTSARLIKGDKYRILVGQRGNLGIDKQINDGFNSTIGNKLPYSSSGGGATFLVKDDIALDTLNFNDDISHLVIAVAGGGSGGRTWDTHDVSHTVTDASTGGPSPGANAADNNDRDILSDPFGQAAIGRGIGISAQGGGGGGGIALDGDLAGTNSSSVGNFQAQSFRNGGKGGLNNFVNDPTAIGKAKEGGFGGGAAGGDGGSGGGGGYIGGGGDMKAGVDIDVDNKSYAGGGGSYVNESSLSMKIARDMSNSDDEYESNGILTIKFNPYNK